jgi:MoaA/NifB/PqqE/SkfB family radical SAM enzyme
MGYAEMVSRLTESQQLYSAVMELTYQCNLDCFFCYNDRGIAGKPLGLEQYFELLRGLRELETLFLTLTGGEPLAHPEFFKIGGYAKELGFVIRIKSNGHALRGPLARRLKKEVDPFNIDISLHGATATTHDQQTRISGSFNRLMENLLVLQDLGIRLKLNATLTQWNAHEVEDMHQLADRLGIPLYCYTAVTSRDDGDSTPRTIEMAPTQKRAALEFLDAHRKQCAEPAADMTLADRGNDMEKEVTRPNCGAGVTSVMIDPVGNVLPCVEWRNPMGNVHETSIVDIWSHSVSLQEVRAKNFAVGKMVDGYGRAGRSMGFCPGMAQKQTDSNTGLYPDSRLKLAFYEDLQKQKEFA